MRKVKRNRHMPLILTAGCALFLLIVYFALVRPLTRAPEEPQTPAVTTGPGEGVLYNKGTIYPTIKRTDMLSIKVHNAEGTYEFRRVPTKDGDPVTKTSPFVMFIEKNGEMKSLPEVAYNEERFSQLVVATGTFYYLRNLANEPEVAGQGITPDQYANYGLAPEDDPAWFELTLLSGGDPIRVYVGDASITGEGYYVRLEGRENAVYVSNSTMVGETALCDLPSFVDPALTIPAVSNGYYYNGDVTFWREIDDVTYRLGSSDKVGFTYREVLDGVLGDEKYTTKDLREFSEDIRAQFVGKKLSDGGFSYTLTYDKDDKDVAEAYRGKTVEYFVEKIERISSLYIALDYVKPSEQPKFFYGMSYQIIAPAEMTGQIPNISRYMGVLEAIGYLTGTETVAVDLDAEVMQKYGLGRYEISFWTPGSLSYDTAEGKEDDVLRSTPFEHYLSISEKQEDGTYYVASLGANIVARVDGALLSFLEYDDSWWLNNNMVSVNIVDIEKFEFSFNYLDFNEKFEFQLGIKPSDEEEDEEEVFYVGEGRLVDVSAFKNLYMHLLTIDYSGAYDGNKPVEDVIAGRSVLTIRMTIRNEGTYVYRFYPYSDRHHLVTVAKEGDPEGGYFYVLAPEVEKIKNDVTKLIEGGTPNPEKQY